MACHCPKNAEHSSNSNSSLNAHEATTTTNATSELTTMTTGTMNSPKSKPSYTQQIHALKEKMSEEEQGGTWTHGIWA